MLKELVENKLSTKLLIIADIAEAPALALFISALRSHIAENWKGKIHLVCWEHPPSCYLPPSVDDRVVVHDFFVDPLGWNDPSAPLSDLSSLTSRPSALADDVFFLDSFALFAEHHGHCAAYRALSVLKGAAAKTVCLVHRDVLEEERVEEVRFLATAFVSVGEPLGEGREEERVGEVVYRKTGGKVFKQSEVFSIADDLKVRSRALEMKGERRESEKEDIEGLTTFRLGLQMSEKEKKAKEELVLPYVRYSVREGEIVYEAEEDEWEEDPDDDLDI